MIVEFNDAFEPIDTCEVPYAPVWLDPERNLFAIVDIIDLQFAIRWLWTPVESLSGKRNINKVYASRTAYVEGSGIGNEGRRRSYRIWLHKEILLRSKGPPPSRSATIGDHLNGNSLDCRRDNLKWSTHSENRLNLFGSVTHQLCLGFKKLEPRHSHNPLRRSMKDLLDT